MWKKTDFTKTEWKRLRTLADRAYERELDVALGEIVEGVDEWRARRMNAFDPSDRIHEFHNGNARELWKFYNTAEPSIIVVTALEQGILLEEDVPKVLRDKPRTRAG